MQVLIVTCVYPPEPLISARTSASLASELSRRGNGVRVVTGYPNRPGGSLFPGYRRRLFGWEHASEGYQILRCFNAFSSESSLASRFLENITFGITSALAVLFLRKVDVIYANTWPVFASGLLWVVARLRGLPLVISIQDVYPESLISQGRLHPQSWLARLLRWIDGSIARGSQAVIVLSDRFARIYRQARRVEPVKIHTIPNWTDSHTGNISPTDNQIRLKYHLPADGFLLVYGGNIGMAAGVETVIKAFARLEDIGRLYLLIAGEGSSLFRCRELVDQLHLERAVFYSPWPAGETSAILSAAHLLLLPTRGNQSQASIPSKLIHYMLAGKPVLASALPESDLADVIRTAGCGWIVKPDDPDELADAIRRIMQLDAAELVRMGRAGREFAQAHFMADACLPEVIHILEQAGSYDV